MSSQELMKILQANWLKKKKSLEMMAFDKRESGTLFQHCWGTFCICQSLLLPPLSWSSWHLITCLIIRLLFGIASDSVFVKLNQNINKLIKSSSSPCSASITIFRDFAAICRVNASFSCEYCLISPSFFHVWTISWSVSDIFLKNKRSSSFLSTGSVLCRSSRHHGALSQTCHLGYTSFTKTGFGSLVPSTEYCRENPKKLEYDNHEWRINVRCDGSAQITWLWDLVLGKMRRCLRADTVLGSTNILSFNTFFFSSPVYQTTKTVAETRRRIGRGSKDKAIEIRPCKLWQRNVVLSYDSDVTLRAAKSRRIFIFAMSVPMLTKSVWRLKGTWTMKKRMKRIGWMVSAAKAQIRSMAIAFSPRTWYDDLMAVNIMEAEDVSKQYFLSVPWNMSSTCLNIYWSSLLINTSPSSV